MRNLPITLLSAVCALGLSLNSTPAKAAVDNQWYEMKTAMGTCLDVPNGWTQNGARIRMWGCNGSYAQQWRYEFVSTFKSGRRLRNRSSWQCLDLPNGSVYGGAPIQQWDCLSNNYQNWMYSSSTIGNANYCSGAWCQIEYTGSGRWNSSGYCVDVPNTSSSWIDVQLWRCNGNPAQSFSHNPR